jgi:hypothetical protein
MHGDSCITAALLDLHWQCSAHQHHVTPADLALLLCALCCVQYVPADERWECHKNALNKAARDLLTLPTAAATATATTSSVPVSPQSPAAEAKSSKQQQHQQQQQQQQQQREVQPVEDSDAPGDVQVEALALWGLYGDEGAGAAGADY